MKKRLTKTRLTDNLSLKVLAFLIAVFTWLVVVNVDDPVTTKVYSGIPVTVLNADEVITDKSRTYEIIDDTDIVTVTIKARRSILSKIKPDDIMATADMKELVLGTQIPIEVNVEKINGKIEETTTKPGNLQVVIDEESTASFPINPAAVGEPREGYVIKSLSVNPIQVTLRGPQGTIKSIHRVAALVDVTGLSDRTVLKAKLMLYDNYDNVIDQTMVENSLDEEGLIVEVELNQEKSVPVVVDPSMIYVRPGYHLTSVKAAPVDISISGSKSVLKKISQIQIPAEAVEMYDVNQSVEIPVDITPYLPDKIKLSDENTNMIVVSVSVEAFGATLYKISTSSIRIDNLKENLDAEFGAAIDAEIQVRGPEDSLQKLSLVDRVSLDLSEYTEPGTYELPLQIDLPQDCSLVSEVPISITISESAEEKDSKTKEE